MSTPSLSEFLDHGLFTTLDRHFARRIAAEAAPSSVLAGHAAALASAMLRRGHVCLRLDQPPNLEEGQEPLITPWPSLAEWRRDLVSSGVVSQSEDSFQPLVLDEQGRLYLHRYAEYEARLATAIRRRVGEGRFQVIVGGPGTGKTTRILDNLVKLVAQVPPPRIALAAPTGKAAKRMEESIRLGIDRLSLEENTRTRIPRTASTLHRLLGARGDSAFFEHQAAHPLEADVVIVDEASMVDLPLMSKLLDALKSTASLMLVGDPDQLASVEAGAVLSDIAEAAGINEGSPAALGTALHVLHQQYRYGAQSGIGQLCDAIRAGDASRALALVEENQFSDIRLRALPSVENLPSAMEKSPLFSALRSALSLHAPDQALEAFNRQRILCPVRMGPHGLEAINTLIESMLAAYGLTRSRPVVLTRNDHSLQLFNGDSGLIVDSSRDGESLAWFQASEGMRSVPALRLPAVETAYAMTVHRSQGSEFDRVLIILPPIHSPLLTRELLYTAVSRARHDVEIWGSPDVLRAACLQKVQRHSGLAARLR